MRYRQIKVRGASVLFDSELIGEDCEQLFDLDWLAAHSQGARLERGKAVMFRYRDRDMVFKQYHRGGLVRHVAQRAYLYSRLRNTRMWREFRVLSRMREMGLPVPRPVAARCVSVPPLVYRGALITERIANARTVADLLTQRRLTSDEWQQLGTLIARFHLKGVYHADLNANNIMLDDSGRFYLIDFDKGEIREDLARRDADANVARLQRSLLKLRRKLPVFHYADEDWPLLEDAYRKAVAAAGGKLGSRVAEQV
ncbi:3-deoxy-D-manno-octulosonic acid kinase [Microbulbifer sp.]|uniref:3-deoxy-D-manno-octulosonic acid kinase n=1 Tax=Microbulbifer sp. TaxID=1908541 RepID=UPI0025862489|nr:3-deoxy-D-manno-octulosonic acid kinase [Microbulbifer sp.]